MQTPDTRLVHRQAGDIELCRLPQLLHRLVMVDGPPRAGKTAVCKILSSFERVELERIEEIYDYVGFLYGLGKIEKDAAVAMLRSFADIHIYNLYLSRNVNCRFGDQSGIFKSAAPLRYLRRMFAREHDATTDAIRREKPIMQQHAHFQFEHIGIHFDAFPDSLQVIEVLRHPLDLLPAHRERGYGGNICESLYNVHLCLRHGETGVHLLARGWEGEFLRMHPVDRMIRMLHGYQMRAFETYCALPEERRRRVLVLAFEDVMIDPNGQAMRLAEFLGTRTTAATGKMIARAGCPRQWSQESRDEALAEIKRDGSAESLVLLDEMIANYEISRDYESRWELESFDSTGGTI